MNFIKIAKISRLKNLRRKVRFLAGGTDIFPLLSDGLLEGETFCDISPLGGLKKIEVGKDTITVGALVTFSQIKESGVLAKYAPCLVQAACEMGSPQIRNRATLGGNVANGSPSGDALPPLFVLKARIKTNRRKIPVEKFFTGPKKTVLENNELITEIVIPKEKVSSAFLKVGPRKALAISKVSAAVSFKMQQGAVDEIMIALGAVAPTVVRAYKTERFLSGKKITGKTIKEAAELVRGEISPIDDFRSTGDYRRMVAGILVSRILEKKGDGSFFLW